MEREGEEDQEKMAGHTHGVLERSHHQRHETIRQR